MRAFPSPDNVQPHKRSIVLPVCCICFAVVIGLDLAVRGIEIQYAELRSAVSCFLKNRLVVLLTLLIAIPVIMTIESFWPADPKQKRWTVSCGNDLAWFFVVKVFKVTVIVWYIYALTWVYDTHFGFLTIPGMAAWPFAARFVVGVLLVDLLSWLHHFIRHKVRILWHFHAIHHSQRQMNLFTDFRFHPFEFFVSEVVKIIPLLILGLTVPTIVAFKIFTMFQSQLYHSNVRLRFGPLRYILVTPQSHRLHHSRQSEHYDKNFGVIFCIWDRMFGTHYEAVDEYPDTGINDGHFPHESQPGIGALIRTLAAQLFYPFQAIAREIRARRSAD